MAHFPQRVGNYVLFAELGAGTLGTTYIGRAVGQGGRVFTPLAIRVLDPQLSSRMDLIRMLLDDQRAVVALHHPRIAAVQEVGMLPDGCYFLATEYAHGVPLREVLRAHGGQLSQAQAVHLAMQLCDALHYAHERLDVTGKPLNMVHGQLTPDAIFVGFDGYIKVTEFGLLQTRDAVTATIPTLLQRRTPYLAPELRAQLPLRAAPTGLDRRADVFSIGVILWEMLTGEPLPMGGHGEALTVPPPSSLRPVDPQLDGLVLQALSKAPAQRPESAQAMRLQLTAMASVFESVSSASMTLSRGMAVSFRGRMTAFQEQLELWRKFEDEALPDAQTASNPQNPTSRRMVTGVGAGAPTGSTATGRSLSGIPVGALSGAPSSISPVPSRSSSSINLAGPRTGSGGRPAQAGSRVFVTLLGVAIVGLLLGLVLLLRSHGTEAGALRIDSEPRGAEIRVNGRSVGRTPLLVPELRGESVQVEIIKDGYRLRSLPVKLKPGDTVSLEERLDALPAGR